MATAHTEDTDRGEDNFVLELRRVKERIQIKFLELRDCLTIRENKLIEELENILERYRSYKMEVEKMNEKKKDIENIRNANTGIVINSTVKSLHDNFLKQLNRELELLEIPVKPKMVKFLFENDKLLDEVNKLGKLVEIVKCGIDYTSKKQPLVSVCKRGTGDEQLPCPRGVTVDGKTGNIYIADQWNHCIKVFDSNARYLFKFGDKQGEGNMYYPKGLAIWGNRVLISQYHCIMNYQLDGKFISKIGKSGNGELEVNYPWGITVDESNGDVYICDSSNNRIQILTETLHYKSQFGKDILTEPRDVKLNKDSIIILDVSNPCLHIFNKDLVLQKNIISRGKGRQVIDPLFFFIDKSDNILISGYGSNSILILNSEFEFIHKISISKPMGITVDDKDRIIVVSLAVENCLRIF